MESQTININKEILAKLTRLESNMAYLKEYLEDITLTGEDIKSIEDYRMEKKAGKLTSHKQIKKEINL